MGGRAAYLGGRPGEGQPLGTYERLSPSDRSFLELEGSTTHMHVAGAFLFEAERLRGPEGQLEIDRIRAYIASRLHLIRRYRQRLAHVPIERHPVWVDDDRFNIDYHVRHVCLPRPGDERQLKRLCGRIVSQQLDRGKPLWEIWIVEGLADDRVAMVTKTHHCMIDGMAGTELLQVLLSPVPVKGFDPGPRWLPNPAPTGAQMLFDAAWQRLRTPFELAGALREAQRTPGVLRERIQDALAGVAQAAAASLQPASDSPLNAEIGPHRRFDWIAFDLDEVKRIKRRLGGTVNDVVLATVAGAVGRFLAHRGVTRTRQRQLDFRAFCPVSVRSSADSGALGNRVASMIASLPIAEEDPASRLEAVTETMGDLKSSKQALGAEVLTSVSEWVAPRLFSLVFRLAFRSRSSNVVVTNVPGPQIPLYLLGARMTEAYPLVPLFENHGLGIALFSYSGGLYWGFNSDWDLFPDLHEFVIAVDAAFRELCDAADGVQRRSRPGSGA